MPVLKTLAMHYLSYVLHSENIYDHFSANMPPTLLLFAPVLYIFSTCVSQTQCICPCNTCIHDTSKG